MNVVYVLLRFPSLTETFIAEEIRHAQQNGIKILLYSLLPPQDKIIHPVSQQLLSQIHYVPDLFNPSLLLAQVYYLFKNPSKYINLLATFLKHPAPNKIFLLKRMVIFSKGIWLARELEDTSVQLVHTHFAWLSAVAAIVVSQLKGIPFTVTTHAYDIYSEKNDLLTLTSRYADRILTISETNKKAILDVSPNLAQAKAEVLHCGIDLEYFHQVSGARANNILQITSVGSLIAKKGHEYLIRACGILQSQNLDFQCLIVGRGDLELSLKALIRELKLHDKVILVGAQTQEWVRDRLGKSDLFVLACVTENSGGRDGIPVALMEAMAMAVPVISTPVSGIPELVQDEKTGLLVPERDPEALAAAISRMSNPTSFRQRIVKNGLDLIKNEYNIQNNTRRLGEIFESVIGAKP